MKYFLYNPLANNGLRPDFTDDMKVIEVIGLDYQKFFDELGEDDEVVMVGGDGTINYLVNACNTDTIKQKIWYKAAGTGNDFLHDIKGDPNEFVLLNDYLKDLPTVYVNGMEKKFINGIGYGIDGYCCEVADKIKEKTPNAKIDYTGIAIKGLLFHFKPRKAKVTIDGEEFEYKHVWIGASMKGKFYGGGMMIAPAQDRKEKGLTLVIYKTWSKIAALIVFPSIFKGEHIKHKKMIEIKKGTEIEVAFEKPCALQIDGETVLNVSSYKVKA